MIRACDPLVAGRNAAAGAIQTSGIAKADFALAFCSGNLDHVEVLKGIHAAAGDVPVLGGSTIGIITNDALSYRGCQTGVAIFSFDDERIGFAGACGLMLRDGSVMVDTTRKQSVSMMNTIIGKGRQPVFGLDIDCAGRSARQSYTDT